MGKKKRKKASQLRGPQERLLPSLPTPWASQQWKEKKENVHEHDTENMNMIHTWRGEDGILIFDSNATLGALCENLQCIFSLRILII